MQDKNVEKVGLGSRPSKSVEGEEFNAESLIICTGAEATWLVEGEVDQKGAFPHAQHAMERFSRARKYCDRRRDSAMETT